MSWAIAFELEPEPPYDFDLTVHKPAGWPLFTPYEHHEPGKLWTATPLCDRLVGIELVSRGTTSRPRIAVGLFAPRAPRDVDAMKQQLRSALGVDERLAEFYAMARRDDILAHAVRHLRGMHDTSPTSLFSEACLAILLQMAPLARSTAMMSAFIERYGAIASFAGKRIRAWPTAARIARLRPRELASRCRVGYRAKLLVDLAKAAPFPSIEQLRAMSAVDAKRRLVELPGIGDYSADIINPHGGFPIDSWSVEVFSLLFFGKVLGNDRRSIERVKREGLRRWGSWAWLAFFYVVQDLPKLSAALDLELRLQ